MSVRNFLNLEVGDLITLEHEVQHPIGLLVNGVQKFSGYQGSYKGHKAISVEELVYVPPAVDEMLVM
jgi:flagellar motor switch protein FliM